MVAVPVVESRRNQPPSDGRNTEMSVLLSPLKSAGSRRASGATVDSRLGPLERLTLLGRLVASTYRLVQVWSPGAAGSTSMLGSLVTLTTTLTVHRSVPVGPPGGWSTTVEEGVRVTTPAASGDETAKGIPAHAVPAAPVAVDERLKTPGSGIGQTFVPERTAPQEGASRSTV